MGPTDKIRVMALLDTRDRLYEEARKRPGSSMGNGLSAAQWNLITAAEGAHNQAVAMMAAEHPLYRPAPWKLEGDI